WPDQQNDQTNQRQRVEQEQRAARIEARGQRAAEVKGNRVEEVLRTTVQGDEEDLRFEELQVLRHERRPQLAAHADEQDGREKCAGGGVQGQPAAPSASVGRAYLGGCFGLIQVSHSAMSFSRERSASAYGSARGT